MSDLPEDVLRALRDHDWSSAEDLALRRLRTEEENAPLWALLAVLSAQKGCTEEALERNQRALALDPNEAGAWLNQGNLEKLAGRSEEATNAYERALVLDPDSADAAFNLGVLSEESSKKDEAVERYRQALQLSPVHTGALFNLGRHLAQDRSPDRAGECEAVELYRRALAESSLWPDAWRNLGNVLRRLGRDSEAIVAYEKFLELDSSDPAVPHLLAALRGDSVAKPGSGYVTQLFDQFAETYEEELSEGLQYEGADRLAQLVRSHLAVEAEGEGRPLRLLDLGCGTGLFLAAVAQETSLAVGVDLSPAMLEKARGRELYDRLEVCDITTYLETSAEFFDVVAAADTFVYIGDLSPVFAGVGERLAPAGIFAFTVESWTDDQGRELNDETFSLQRSGRYRHAAAHLARLIEQYKFEVLSWVRAPLRRENGETLVGEYVVLRQQTEG